MNQGLPTETPIAVGDPFVAGELPSPLVALRDPRADAPCAEAVRSLRVDEVTVSFDGFKVLDELSLELYEGELRCLIGPNGAGKTTLMDVMTGRVRPTAGRVEFYGIELAGRADWEIARLGIGRKFQRPTIFPMHTVEENLELALRGPRGVLASLFARLTADERTDLERTLAFVGLADQARSRAGLLSHGQKQWLEIGMLLVQDPKVLLIDEPVAGMTHEEMDRTAELFDRLAGKHTLLVVEHDMEFVRSIARTVTVLHEGRVLAEGRMDEIQADARVREVYLGS